MDEESEDAAGGPTSALNWREELKERLSRHSSRKQAGTGPDSEGTPKPAEGLVAEPSGGDRKTEPRTQGEPERDFPPLTSAPATPAADFPKTDPPLDQPTISGLPGRSGRSASAEPGLKLRESSAEPVLASLLKRPGPGRQPLPNPVRSQESPAGAGAGAEAPLEVPLRRPMAADRPMEPLRPRPLPLSTVAGSPASPQKLLDLEPPAEPPVPAAEPPEVHSEAYKPVPREILVSRALCGVIDLTLAAILGLVFMVIASRLAGFDLFSGLALLAAGGLAVCFQIFNSLFFFITCGQTPGMAATQLRLAPEPGREITLKALFARTMLFLPTLTSVVGMAWALRDPYRRCAHDVLSRTVVEAD